MFHNFQKLKSGILFMVIYKCIFAYVMYALQIHHLLFKTVLVTNSLVADFAPIIVNSS